MNLIVSDISKPNSGLRGPVNPLRFCFYVSHSTRIFPPLVNLCFLPLRYEACTRNQIRPKMDLPMLSPMSAKQKLPKFQCLALKVSSINKSFYQPISACLLGTSYLTGSKTSLCSNIRKVISL